MNKKGQKNGIIALLLIALMVFVGCPTGGGTDPDDPSNGGDTTTGGSSTGGGGGGGIDPTPADVKAAENLAIQINEDFGDKYIAWVPGKAEITLIKDLEIPKSETLSIQAASGGSTAFSVSRVAGDTENPLTIPSGVIFVVNAGRKLTVNSSGVVTNNGTIRVEKTGADVFGTIKVSGGTLTASGPITVAGAIEVTGGGSLEVKKEITVTGTLTVSGEEASVTVAGDATLTVEGNVEVATGGTLMVEGTITTGSESTIKVEGIITTGSESTITVEGNVEVATGGTLTVEGTITTGSESTIKVEGNVTGAGTIEGQGTITVVGDGNIGDEIATDTDEGATLERNLSVNTVDDLNAAISAAKSSAYTYTITLSEAFYTAANSAETAIVVDPNATDNETPYTIKGQGTGDGAPALTAGILLANDNVTLDGVKINLTDTTKAASIPWTASTDYNTGILIARSADGTDLLTGADLPSKDVKVTNSTVTVDFSNSTDTFTAGIIVHATRSSDGNTLYPATNITISENTISATGKGGYATQGLFISSYDYSVVITDNTIKAQYGTAQTGTRNGAPASALFFSLVFGEDLMGTGTPNISGNTLTLETDGTYAYSFYINAVQKYTKAAIDTHAGVDVLRADKFTLYETTWALSTANDTGSSYKKLFNALLANISGSGFGFISIPWSTDNDGRTNAFDYEHYKIDSGAVTAISVLGDHLNADGTVYAGDSVANKFGTEGSAPNGVDYGSFAVSNGEVSGDKNGKFYYTYSSQDTDYNYTK